MGNALPKGVLTWFVSFQGSVNLERWLGKLLLTVHRSPLTAGTEGTGFNCK